MSEAKALPRPRQVTVAAVMSMVTAAILVISLFDTLDRLRGPDTRESIGKFLAEPPGDTLNVTVAQVVDLMRAVVFVSGALAAICLVFAAYVLQKHAGARIGFSIAAGLSVLTAPVTGMLPMFLAAGAALMWTRPARDWFAGRAPVQPPTPVSLNQLDQAGSYPPAQPPVQPPAQPPVQPPAQPPVQPPTQAPVEPTGSGPQGQQPPPSPYPFGAPYGPPGQQPAEQSTRQLAQPPAQPQGYYPYSSPQPALDGARRPTGVTVAVVLTWLGSGAIAGSMALFMIVLVSGSDAFVTEFNKAAAEQGITVTRNQLLAAAWSLAAVLMLWSLIATVLAAFTLRRSQAARIGLIISASVTVLASLLMILSIVSVIPLIVAGVAIVLLLTGGANDWFARRTPAGQWPDPRQGPGQPPVGPPQPPQPQQREKPW